VSVATETREALSGAHEAPEAVATDSAAIGVGELAARLRRQGIRVEQATLNGFLRSWERQGVTERTPAGRWRLTVEGACRFSLVGQIEPR